MVRKSFDARKAKPKAWAYVIDVDTAAALDAGATRLEIRPGLLEWMPPEEHPAPLPPLPGGERRLLTVTATPPAAAATPPPAPPPEAPPPHAAAAAGGHDSSRRGGGAGAGAGGGKRAVPVVVVGAGPAGLFAALAVAEAGLPVTLLEKGQAVEQRGRDIGALFVRRVLNPESNLCYGEGGAGTWSDGKLTTRIGRNSDPVRQVLATLHALGAPDAVLYSGKPHMGTENLVRILRNFRAHLQALGVTIRFGASVKDFEVTNGRCSGVVLTDGERLPASAVVLAPGHSARPLYTALADRGVALSAKPFALGFRVEHPQVWLDEAQYGAEDARGVMRGKGKLPVADYTLATNIMDAVGREDAVDGSLTGAASLTGQSGGNGGQSGGAQPNGGSGAAAVGMQGTTGGCCGGDEAMHTSGVSSGGGKGSGGGGGGGSAAGAGGAEGVVVSEGEGSRGVYSFCMCPGGQIVPTSTQEDELCINGMSFSKRSSPWCNSALVVAVRPRDWERYNDAHGPLAGVELQREMEREGARRGGGGLVAPVQRVEDFLEGRVTATARLPRSSYRLGVRSTPLHDLYPLELSRALTAALTEFDRRLPGFATGKGRGLLHGVETRTSAPVRVERRQEDCCSVSLEGLYPSGEGAGYAGGIVSAAVDGLRVGGAVVEALTGVDIGLGF